MTHIDITIECKKRNVSADSQQLDGLEVVQIDCLEAEANVELVETYHKVLESPNAAVVEAGHVGDSGKARLACKDVNATTIVMGAAGWVTMRTWRRGSGGKSLRAISRGTS